MIGLVFEDNDLKIKDGYLVLGDNRLGMIEAIVDSNKGEWKENAYLGVGIMRMIGKSVNGDDEIRNEVIENLKRADIDYKNITVEDSNIEITI